MPMLYVKIFRMLMLGTRMYTFLNLDTISAKSSAMMVLPEPMMWNSSTLLFSSRMLRSRKSSVANWCGRMLGMLSTCSRKSETMPRFIYYSRDLRRRYARRPRRAPSCAWQRPAPHVREVRVLARIRERRRCLPAQPLPS
nr:MAG: hypothetical protein [Molluscum contagiosum virus]